MRHSLKESLLPGPAVRGNAALWGAGGQGMGLQGTESNVGSALLLGQGSTVKPGLRETFPA